MRFQVVSDIHLECRSEEIDSAEFTKFIQPCAEVLALVGDIGQPDDGNLPRFLKWCSDNYQHVLYVAGNHEFYNASSVPYHKILHQLRTICEKFSNVHFLNNKVFIVDDIAFIGSTLWSRIPPELNSFIKNYMKDYSVIFNETGNRITTAETNELFSSNCDFINKSIVEAEKMKLKAVVLTHHTPSFKNTSAPEYRMSPSGFAFSTHLPATFWSGPIHLWCCGHTHYNFDHNKEGYRLVSNQVGYDQPMQTHNPKMFIEL